MPSMQEIYERYADRYDELVTAEDIHNNLGQLLIDLADWQETTVIEAGIGTGRVTKLYIEQASAVSGYDLSPHMLNYARQALASHHAKLTLAQAENTALPQLPAPADIFVEGWSFGHTATACVTTAALETATQQLVTSATKNLRPGGRAILIETQGTNVETAAPPHEKLQAFYTLLEQEHHFAPHLIRTDYQFTSNEEACRVMGFFFGEHMAQGVRQRGTAVIPEWTGVWVKEI